VATHWTRSRRSFAVILSVAPGLGQARAVEVAERDVFRSAHRQGQVRRLIHAEEVFQKSSSLW